jgi:hypothetical protein
MAKPLTIMALENLKPTSRRREVSDGGMPGLYFVIQPSGKRSWAYRYRFNGRPRKWTIGPCPAIDLKTARELAREALRKVATGADPCAEKKAAKLAPTGLDLIETVTSRFVAQHAKRKLKAATAREIERLLEKEVVAPWRGRRLSQIGRADIHDLLDGIRMQPNIKSHCRMRLSRYFKHCRGLPIAILFSRFPAAFRSAGSTISRPASMI